MQELSLNKKDLLKLRLINYGAESRIYRIDDNEVFKKFRPDTSRNVIANKIKKLKLLEIIDSEYLIKPLRIVKYNGEIIGYTIEYDEDDLDMSMSPLLRREEIEILRKVKFINKKLFENNIFYGDLSQSNILINSKTGRVRFCDICNTSIGNLPMDISPNTLKRYQRLISTIDGRTLSYLHNVLTLKLFYDDTELFEDDIRNVENGIYPSEFSFSARTITDMTVNLDEKYKEEYIIDKIR